jgi:hypothetical protein
MPAFASTDIVSATSFILFWPHSVRHELWIKLVLLITEPRKHEANQRLPQGGKGDV